MNRYAEGKQMTAGRPAGAPSAEARDWARIDWRTVRTEVYRLQVRIAKAVREGRWGKVKALQRLLAHSYSAKQLAVRRVVTNHGRHTPGVDGVRWRTLGQKQQAVVLLRRRGYRPRPLRRVYILKSNGKQRPLGIPTMHDRAMQALYSLALEPVVEMYADPNSYGFRPRRSLHDAIGQCFSVLAKKHSPRWILDADIKACFDRISHGWLLAHVPMDKGILKAWLTAGYIEENALHVTEEGTPQGGIVSPLLANWALDGLERAVKAAVARRGAKVNVVRYADDFIVTGCDERLLREEVLPVVTAFLEPRGLTLSEEKTRIRCIDQGFDFLGFNLRKYGGKLLIKPAPQKISAFLGRIKECVQSLLGAPVAALIRKLNSMLRGFALHCRHVVAKRSFDYIDKAVLRHVRQWLKHEHPNKTPAWLERRYFQQQGTRRMLCTPAAKGTRSRLTLFQTSDVSIQRHVKIRGLARVYDPRSEDYFEQRRRQQWLWRRTDRLRLAARGLGAGSVGALS
jgi:RNA-directed DNA polymerase